MNDKSIAKTTNADGLVVTVIADTKAALTTAINLKKNDRKKGFNGE